MNTSTKRQNNRSSNMVLASCLALASTAAGLLFRAEKRPFLYPSRTSRRPFSGILARRSRRFHAFPRVPAHSHAFPRVPASTRAITHAPPARERRQSRAGPCFRSGNRETPPNASRAKRPKGSRGCRAGLAGLRARGAGGERVAGARASREAGGGSRDKDAGAGEKSRAGRAAGHRGIFAAGIFRLERWTLPDVERATRKAFPSRLTANYFTLSVLSCVKLKMKNALICLDLFSVEDKVIRHGKRRSQAQVGKSERRRKKN